MKKISWFLIISIIFFGCSKKNNSYIDNNYTNKTIDIGSDSIGIIHNEGLTYIIDNYQNVGKNIDELFVDINDLQKEFFKSKGFNPEDMSLELKDLILTGDGIIWLNNLYENHKITISVELKNYLTDILRFTYKGIDKPISRNDYFTFLDSIYTVAKKSLSNNELNQLANHISVAKSSYDYWFYDDGSPRDVIKIYNRSWNGWETLGADCIGGIFGGACGFLGASALDVFYQVID